MNKRSFFTTIPTRALDELSNAEYKILGLLCSYLGETNQVWPSIAKLSERAKISKRNVKLYIKKLEELGYITVEERFSKNGGQLSNIISIVFDDGKRIKAEDIPEENEGDDLSPGGCHSLSPPGVSDYHPNISKPLEQSSSRAEPSENPQDEKTKLARWILDTAPGVGIHMDEINYWLDEGCDIENHVKPTIKRMVLNAIENNLAIGSIYYFRKAILNAKNKKTPKAQEPEQIEKEFAANKDGLLESTKELCDHPAWHAMCEWSLKTFGYRDFFSYFARAFNVRVDPDNDLLKISVEGGYTRQHWGDYYKEDLEQIAYENGLDGVEIS